MGKYKYHINNLDCANCAREIEEMLNKNENFNNASVNFNTCKVFFESKKNYRLEELNELIKKVEPDAFLTEEEIEEKKEYHLSILLIAILLGFISYLCPLPNFIKIIMMFKHWLLYLGHYKQSWN